MAVVPFHGALLDLEEDSTGVLSAIFAAVLPSLGAYGLIHVAAGFFPTVAGGFSLFFAGLAVVTVVWAGLAALRTDDLRRLIGHVGTVLMGVVLLGVAGHTTVSITGIMYLLIARGLVVAVLMLLASAIQEQTRRRAHLPARWAGVAGAAPLHVLVAGRPDRRGHPSARRLRRRVLGLHRFVPRPPMGDRRRAGGNAARPAVSWSGQPSASSSGPPATPSSGSGTSGPLS